MRAPEGSVAPRSRVRLCCDPAGEEELPFKILVLGDYTQRPDPRSLEERRPVTVDKDSFNQVLADHALGLDLTVPDRLSRTEGAVMSLHLGFKSMKDFAPEGIVRQAPSMHDLLEQRTALLALKSPGLRLPTRRILAVLDDEAGRRRLRQELGHDGDAPPAEADGSLIDSFLSEAHVEPTNVGYARFRRGLELFLAARMTTRFAGESPRRSSLDDLIADIDQRLSAQVNEVLRHPAFQRLEAAWRTLKFVVDRVDFRENVRLEVLDCSKDDLQIDFRDAPVDGRSGLSLQVCDAANGASGGAPYGLIVADYVFGLAPKDVWLLTRCAAVAAAAHAPLVAGASPAMIGEASWEHGPEGEELQRHLEAPAHKRWQDFRDSDDARYVGLCLPRFLLRLPYSAATVPVRAFNFEEDVVGHPERYLWGNAAAALATRAADAFAKFPSCPNVVGERDGLVEALPLHQYELAGEVCAQCPLDLLLTRRQERALSEEGLIVLTWLPGTDQARFLSAASRLGSFVVSFTSGTTLARP